MGRGEPMNVVGIAPAEARKELNLHWRVPSVKKHSTAVLEGAMPCACNRKVAVLIPNTTALGPAHSRRLFP